MQENPNDELAQKINQLQHKKTLFSKRTAEDKSQLVEHSSENDKLIKNWLDLDDDQNNDSDTGSIENDSDMENKDDNSENDEIDNASNTEDKDNNNKL